MPTWNNLLTFFNSLWSFFVENVHSPYEVSLFSNFGMLWGTLMRLPQKSKFLLKYIEIKSKLNGSGTLCAWIKKSVDWNLSLTFADKKLWVKMTTILFEGCRCDMKLKPSPVNPLNNRKQMVTLKYFQFTDDDKN